MSEQPRHKESVKQRIGREFKAYLVNSAFLMVVLLALVNYRALTTAEFQVGAFQYGWAIVESLILGKLVLIGEALRLGTRFQDQPIVVSVLWKTLVFMVFVLVFMLAEHVVKAKIHHQSLAAEVDYSRATKFEMLARLQLLFVAFLPLFAYRELGRVLGEEKLDALLFRKRPAGTSPGAPA